MAKERRTTLEPATEDWFRAGFNLATSLANYFQLRVSEIRSRPTEPGEARQQWDDSRDELTGVLREAAAATIEILESRPSRRRQGTPRPDRYLDVARAPAKVLGCGVAVSMVQIHFYANVEGHVRDLRGLRTAWVSSREYAGRQFDADILDDALSLVGVVDGEVGGAAVLGRERPSMIEPGQVLSRARSAVDRVVASMDVTPRTLYNAACFYVSGPPAMFDESQARSCLGQAFALDAQLRRYARTDPSLSPLHGSEWWTALVGDDPESDATEHDH